jgi:hypothetical protein
MRDAVVVEDARVTLGVISDEVSEDSRADTTASGCEYRQKGTGVDEIQLTLE